MAVAMATKEEFRERIKGLLSEKGLEVADLQVNLKEEDVEQFMGFIGKDWYTFGTLMGVERNTMDHIKEVSVNKEGRKRKLLEYLVKLDKARYEDLIYGLYNSANKQDPAINDILDYLKSKRIFEGSKPQHTEKPFLRQSSQPWHMTKSFSRQSSYALYQEQPWQTRYKDRSKHPPSMLTSLSGLTPENYQEYFYSVLWHEELEHMTKLKEKCDGSYKLYMYDKTPPYLGSHADGSRYGFISGLTDDKIEYATQASDTVTIAETNGSYICKAFKHRYNFKHFESKMYVYFHGVQLFNLPKIKERCTRIDGCYEIQAKFEVKHSYFDQLHDAVVKAPDFVKKCLIPNEHSFSELHSTFDPIYSQFKFMKLDEEKQSEALRMITSVSSNCDITTCPPPVILYGPFGSGKTRILARAAYEIMMNGIDKREYTRILICAHHSQSIEIFIYAYFGRIDKTKGQSDQLKVIEISNSEKTDIYADLYMTMDEFSSQSTEICQESHIIIITTYTMSLNLHQYFRNGFFTHLLLDEAAQVREPEALAPLSMATRNAKIVLAGDNKQVGPNILVFGEQARKFDLHISLLERMMKHYEELSQVNSVAASYVTTLSANYRSHESLVALPKQLFYPNLDPNPKKQPWEHKGPSGYSFICSDSRLIDMQDISQNFDDHPLVEACVVLEEVVRYMNKMDDMGNHYHPRNICIISSTRKQLNQIKDMAFHYKEYKTVRSVSFKPSYMIQGHEFEAIFLSLFEPFKYDKMDAFYIKSLFNPYVFNTVITRARTRVVAIGRPMDVLKYEKSRPDSELCWHHYIKLCLYRKTLQHDVSVDGDIASELDGFCPKRTMSETEPAKIPTTPPTDKAHSYMHWSTPEIVPSEDIRKLTALSSPSNSADITGQSHTDSKDGNTDSQLGDVCSESENLSTDTESIDSERDAEYQMLLEKITTLQEENDDLKLKLDRNSKRAKYKLKTKERELKKVIERLEIELKEQSGEKVTELEDQKSQDEIGNFQKVDPLDGSLQVDKTKTLEKEQVSVADKCVQFNYLVPSVDGLQDVHVAGKKLFLVQSNSPQLLNWEEYGFRMAIPEEALVSSDTSEVAITALVGGQFIFPEDTELVSAVYHISVSKPFLKPVQLAIQHCVSIETVDHTSYLSFATAPVDQSIPYQFQLVKGGQFSPGDQYGSISLSQFSLWSIIKRVLSRRQRSTSTTLPQVSVEAGETAPVKCYVGQVIYEVKQTGRQWLMTFLVSKNLNALLEFIGRTFPNSCERDIHISFKFNEVNGSIELVVDSEHKPPPAGWTIRPHAIPSIISQEEVDTYDSYSPPNCPSCLITVSVTPGDCTVSELQYPVALKGINSSTQILNIIRSVGAVTPSVSHPSVTGSSSPVVSAATATANPVDVFRKNMFKLSDALRVTSTFDRVVDNLFSEGLITMTLVDDITSNTSYTNYQRGSNVARELYRQIDKSETPKDVLMTIRDVLLNQEDDQLKKLGHSMKCFH